MDATFLNLIGTITGVAITVGTIIGAIVYGRAKAKASAANGSDAITTKAFTELQITVNALTTQNGIQAGQIEESKAAAAIQGKKISELTGKVDTLSTIPLAKIEQHMSDTNKILQSILPLIAQPSTEHTVVETTTIKK